MNMIPPGYRRPVPDPLNIDICDYLMQRMHETEFMSQDHEAIARGRRHM